MDDVTRRTLNVINNAAGEQNPPGPCEVGTAEKSDVELLDAYSRAVITVAEAVGPAVVSISTETRSSSAGPEAGGAGSGVIIAPDGYILTNDHVVHGSKSLVVSLTNGTTHAAAEGHPGSVERLRQSVAVASLTAEGATAPLSGSA